MALVRDAARDRQRLAANESAGRLKQRRARLLDRVHDRAGNDPAWTREGDGLAGGSDQCHASCRACHRERHREVGPGLVRAHASDDVDEHVSCAQADPRMAAEHCEH